MIPDSSLESKWTPCYITAAEMQANAGEFGDPITAHLQRYETVNGERFKLPTPKEVEANFAWEAQQKIKAWPTIGDDKAPRVGVRA